MATPHISAEKGQFAKTVLMPGDPLRAQFIAQNYLENPVEVNHVRGMLAYTGTYQGKPVSVMGSGMGMPSIGIYSYELFSFYDVENIIRIGSAGAYTDQVKLYDVVLATASYSESSFAKAQNGATQELIYPSEQLVKQIEQSADQLKLPINKGVIHSSDVFYHAENTFDFTQLYQKYGCLCVEMESFALFHNANVLQKNAACLLTISDSLVTHEETTAQERQNSFTNMMEIALHSIV